MLLVLVLDLGLLLSSCGSNDGGVFPAESSDEDYFARLLALWGKPDDTSMPVTYFPGNNGKDGWQLWATDGTKAGTRQVKIINKGGHSAPNGFIRFNHRVFFKADDGAHGWELWVTDGTERGTKLVKDINPGAGGSDPSYLTVFNGRLYFSAYHPDDGEELWVTDGTKTGTKLVKDIRDGDKGSNPTQFAFSSDSGYRFTPINGRLYFGADDGESGYELWVTDGTEAGTGRVIDINRGPGDGVMDID